MSQVEQYLSLAPIELRNWKSYLADTWFALIGATSATFTVYKLDLFTSFTVIFLVYASMICILAFLRGFYAAFMSALLAFLSFGLFVIPFADDIPSHTSEKWVFFLCILVSTALIGTFSVSRKRAKRQELELRMLYQLMKDIDGKEDLEVQLQTIAASIVQIFGSWGVRDCSFMEKGGDEGLLLRAQAPQSVCVRQIPLDEESTILQAMKHGEPRVLYDASFISSHPGATAIRFTVANTVIKQVPHRFVYIDPLKRGQEVIGGLRLIIEGDPQLFETNNPQTAYFRTFVDQAKSVIERAHLRHEKLQVETWRCTDELRASLIHSVSHDLRTPLSTIKIAASTLQQLGMHQDDELLQNCASNIQQEADRLNRLVTNLLGVSSIEGKTLYLEKELHPPDALIYNALGHMQTLLQDRPIQLYLPDDLPPVEVDPTRIDEVLTNILENIVRYTPARSPIEIRAQVSGEHILVSIADSGPGIAQSNLELIFDKFYRVKKQQYNDLLPAGSGLGLAICRGIIEAHGGRIWAANGENGGAIFSFTLPLSTVPLPMWEVEIHAKEGFLHPCD
ncbi:MAG TPA: ATP-binding protein [Ktedonobacteraceae bacterium]|nr:ATP-binding protein [Ktedonobacteraceae bacterium]